MDLLDIIKERPLTEPHTGFGTCPYCESNDVCVTNRTTTLLGFSGPVDPNHQWHSSTCRSCHKNFTREVKGLNVWYTAEIDRETRGPAQVLRGLPSCFESYQYTCSKCAGPVVRTNRDMAGNPTQTLSSRNVDGKWVNEYTTHYNCTQCGHGGEVDQDHYRG